MGQENGGFVVAGHIAIKEPANGEARFIWRFVGRVHQQVDLAACAARPRLSANRWPIKMPAPVVGYQVLARHQAIPEELLRF